MQKELTFAELFCGIGGFRLGLEKSGWKCVWANDKDRSASRIYSYRFGCDEYIEADIKTIDVNTIPNHTLLTAGFPCPTFSLAGDREGFKDSRGALFYEICRVAEAKRPPLLLLENVKGILNHDEGVTFQIILESLADLGYLVEWQVLNSEYFGVPQNRERVFIVGHLRGESTRTIFPIGEAIPKTATTIRKPLNKFRNNLNNGLLSEKRLLHILKKSKKTVLLEPEYKRRYIPLGLAKIATYIKQHNGEVVFQRKYTPCGEDLVCITSLFTYDSQIILDTISNVVSSAFFTKPKDVIVGGVYASLMPQDILKRYPKVFVFKGYSKRLDMAPPDYTIDWKLEPPWDKFSFVFTTRGCPNKCPYCAVWRIEPDIWINPNWREAIDPSKPYVMISDNNLSAQPFKHIKNVCNFLIKHKLRVIFDNGFDCKHITPKLAKLLAQLKFTRHGMRLAFDRIEEDGIFQNALKILLAAGIPKAQIMVYVLFNFSDSPKEADYRMRECVKLGVSPYPQRFTPLNRRKKEPPFISKLWTRKLATVFRYFWLMRGFHTHNDFGEWFQQESWMKRFRLTAEDVKCWNRQNVEYTVPSTIPKRNVKILSHSPRTNDPKFGGAGPLISADHCFTLDSTPHKLIENGRIRNLTLTECERLQGFPDGWTRGVSRTNRQKLLGNAVTVNVIKYLGEQLIRCMREAEISS